MAFGAITLFRAFKKPNGQVVVTDPQHLEATCKVARTEYDFLIMKGQGWCDSPQEAIDQFEAEEQRISNEATYRAHDDKGMSEKALAEVDAYEATTSQHVPEVPEMVKKPRAKKKA